MERWKQVIVVAGFVSTALGCNEIAQIDAGFPRGDDPIVACLTLGDCSGTGAQCRVATDCKEGLCVYGNAPEGTSGVMQRPGDCAEFLCDGLGGAKRTEATVGCACGDGLVSGGEECDDGGVDDNDMCSSACLDQTVIQVAAGGYHTCALVGRGRVRCWGYNEFGQLGVGDRLNRGDEPYEMGRYLTDCDLGKGRMALAITAGLGHTCALLDGGSVKCWGRNEKGQLGLGDILHRGDEPNEMGDALPSVDLGVGNEASAVVAKWLHTCALLTDGRIKCWGDNSLGALGLGDKLSRGDETGEMGELLPNVDLGTGKLVYGIAVGHKYACARLTDNSIKCWGDNSSGKLGLGDVWNHGDEPGEMGDKLPAVDLGLYKPVSNIVAGAQHACATLLGGIVKCWGNNDLGKLGLGDTLDRGKTSSEMGDNLPTVDLGSGKLAAGVTVGDEHTCVRLTDGDIKCWGDNEFGKLGIGNVLAQGDAPNETGEALPSVLLGTGKRASAIDAGGNHSCAILQDGTVKCWGSNQKGQLGLGDQMDRGDELSEMGDELPPVKLFSDAR